MTPDKHVDGTARWRALFLICLGVVGALSTWFSATAIIGALQSNLALSQYSASWITTSVQIGFVFGALLASYINLPDLVPLNRLIAISSLFAGLSNAALLAEPDFGTVLLCRFLTGFALAGVYPPALKLVATWFQRGRGLAMGFMVGALSLGSALPYLFRGVATGLDWRIVVVSASLATFASGLLFWVLVRDGPYSFGRAVFQPRQLIKLLKSRPVFLANMGYFGHMWELYAMWAWIVTFLSAAQASGAGEQVGRAAIFGFVAIASGAFGCVLGGYLSDRIGRCYTTAGMMAISGFCAASIGFAFNGPLWLVVLLAIIWGISIVGDSAQFSAAVTELVDQRLVGTALALQMGIGFAITIGAITAVPVVVGFLGGWQWGFLILAPGPIVGIWSMLALRNLPEAKALSSGLR